MSVNQLTPVLLLLGILNEIKTLSEVVVKDLHEDLLCGLVVDSPPGLVWSLGLLHVHVEAVDGVASLIDWSFPQQHH